MLLVLILLNGIKFNGMSFEGAILIDTNFTGSKNVTLIPKLINGRNLGGAKLSGVDFSNLTFSDLSANYFNTDFANAMITEDQKKYLANINSKGLKTQIINLDKAIVCKKNAYDKYMGYVKTLFK